MSPSKNDEIALAIARVEAKVDAVTMDLRRLVDRETNRNGRIRGLEIKQAETDTRRKTEKEERKSAEHKFRWFVATAIAVAALLGPVSDFLIR